MKHPLVKAADDLRKQLRNLTFPDPVLGVRTRVMSLTPVSNDEVYYRLKVEL